VRETLFNWLAPVLPGARCLDLFAGTGALGFEAVSRGAASCDLVEQDAALARGLEALRDRLRASAIAVHRADALAWLRETPRPYDVVFVDPPFDAALASPVLDLLARGWLSPAGLVYLETARAQPAAPTGWVTVRSGETRHVRYALLRRSPTGMPAI
jgi:16S rRNA (guanine966-N2)-methyltransferase